MIIPADALSAAALQGVIEQFILREGTDYGEQDFSLQHKISTVRQQLSQGTVLLVYSELYQTVNLIPANQYQFSSDHQSPPAIFG
jgi:uncharacterized protein